MKSATVDENMYRPRHQEVQSMFGSIAERYDFTNTVLSFGMHYLWRRLVLQQIDFSASSRAIDICTGTGDLIKPLASRVGHVTGVDFCRPMLVAGQQKVAKKVNAGRASLVQADALNLPFQDRTFDVATVAFGVRNFENLATGLTEIRRVLQDSGRLVVLEFGQPTGVWGALFRLYSKFFMPLIGGTLTGNFHAYRYLPQTASNFPCGDNFAEILRTCGFSVSKVQALSGGIAYLYVADCC